MFQNVLFGQTYVHYNFSALKRISPEQDLEKGYRKGVIVIEDEDLDEEAVTMDALEAGAEDLEVDGEIAEITTDPNEMGAVRDALAEKYTISSAEVSMVPQTMTQLTDEGQIASMTKLLDMLEDNDDVQDVYHNWEMPDEE